MPYRSSYYRRKTPSTFRRKTYRKGKRGTRKRFARKTFRKSMTLRSGLYIPKEAYVKLPLTQIIQSPALTAGANYNIGIWGAGITCPFSTITSGVPSPGDLYPLGLTQYSEFYKYYKVLGCSAKVQINSSTTISGDSSATASASYFCSLVAATGSPYSTDSDSNWVTMVNASTQDLISYPGCSWKLLSGTTGNNQNAYLKGWRKTKNMISVKDVRDCDELQGLLPGTDGIYPNGRNPGFPDSSWFWLLRIDPNLTVNIPANSFQIVIKLKYYVQLYGRDFNVQTAVPA